MNAVSFDFKAFVYAVEMENSSIMYDCYSICRAAGWL